MSKQFKCTQCKQDFDISIKGKFQSEKITNKRTGEQSITIKHFCSEECKSLFDNPPKSDYRILTDYINDIYLNNGVKLNNSQWKMITKQLENMTSQNNYTYTGVKYCLWYMVELEQMSLINDDYDGSILNLVPYYYDESKNFWYKKDEIQKAVREFDFSDNIIIIKRKSKDEIKYNNDIDISTL